jgi:signal transduction histidine kinase
VLLEDLHGLAIDLRPTVLDHLGLLAALAQFCENVTEKSGLQVELTTLGKIEPLAEDMQIAIYRIVQEAVNNSVRHAQACRIEVLLERRGEDIVMVIEDDGAGFDPTQLGRNGRLGILGMRERADMFGGRLDIESQPGGGTSIIVKIPSHGTSPEIH